MGVLVSAPLPATSATTTLCAGWTGCPAAGYSDAGYGAASKASYWRMFSGHNCTNYVAYRMIQAGMSTERPFSGTGNAYNWGLQMASKTDQNPTVGAVAWWNKNVPGAGSAGHVAYVEQVISPTEIVVSEDSYGGDFKWRRITQGSGWPSGFIHLTDRPVVNTSPVTVTGTPQVGQTLSSTPGGWAPAAGYTYQWYADGQPLPGATSPSLALNSSLGGSVLVLRVVAALSGYASTTADSAAVTVGLGSLAPSAAPGVDGASGRLMVGETLTASQPTWSPTARRTKVQWLADGAPIPGATDWSLQLTADQVGRTVTPVVTARRPGYASTPVQGATVGPVLGGVVEITKDFKVTGRSRVGRQLSVSPVAVAPSDATTGYTWLRNGVAIPGANGPTYALTVQDAGKTIAVDVRVAKAGWAGRSRKVSTGTKVAARPVLALKTAGQNGRAVVWFRVSAPGTSKPDGTAVVTVGSTVRTVTVRDGIGRLALRGLTPGSRPVTVAWQAAQGVLAGSIAGKVRVKD